MIDSKIIKIVMLVRTLESKKVSTDSKLTAIKSARNMGVIDDLEAIDLICEYNITK